MDLAPQALPFALTALLIELTPGPNMVWLAVLALSQGRRAGLAAVLGVALGLATVGALVGLGLGELSQRVPLIYQALRWGGALYLLWLAYEGWREAATPAADDPLALPERPLRLWLWRGFLTNILNPKAAVFYLAILPPFLTLGGPAEITSLALIYVAIATLIHAGIVLAAASARRLLTDPARERRLRRGLALSLVAVALWVLWRS